MSYSRFKMLRKVVNGIPTGEFTQGELLPYSPFDTFEECDEGNASPGVTPDNPDLTYRWIVSSTPWCDGTDEYKTEKQQQSPDNVVWTDTGATRRGEFVGSHSFNCGYIAERWVNISDEFVCENGDKYAKQKKQISHDGVTWTDTGNTRRGALIESQSSDCTYPQTRWVEIPLDVDYVCVGEDKYYKEKQQVTNDGITWEDVIPLNTRKGRGAEVHSVDCGYEPPSYITRWVDVSGEYVCQGTNKYQKQKEQISNDSGQTWQDTGNVRAGSLIESQSYDCGYVSYRWVTDPSNYVCQGLDKYAQEIEESTNDGEVWTPTGSTRTGALIERNSYDCDYVSYRWVTVSGQYVCSGTDKYTVEKEQSTTDGEVWVDTGRERAGSLIESQSYSCGYISYRWVTVPNTPWCDGYDLYTTEKQQYTTDGTNWQDVTPLNTRKGALVERNSDTCGYVPPTPANDYLTFTSLEDGNTFSFTKNAASGSISYSLDNGSTWTSGSSVTVNNGQSVKFKGNMIPSSSSSTGTGMGTFSSTGRFNASGCPDSLIFGDNYGQTDLTGYDYAFDRLFKDCTYLVDISGLSLPATTLARDCYVNMFRRCMSLTSIPSGLLPATTLARECYSRMFYQCYNLTSIPSNLLPATTLAYLCYEQMFIECYNLTSIPSNLLPATTLAQSCYSSMFYGCRSLTTAPVLPATTLEYYCYSGMFYGCTSLTTAPDLPATTLTVSCYGGMFRGCTNLNYIKMLATDISANRCLSNWVDGVQTNSGTFVKAPCVQIPRGTSGIPNNWTVVEETVTQERWVDVSGEFVCQGTDKYQKQKKQLSTDCGSTWSDSSPLETRAGSLIETGSSDCSTPTGDYLTFTSLEDGNGISFNKEYYAKGSIYYSTDNGNTWIDGNGATINSGETIKFKGNLNSSFSIGIGIFSSTGRFNASGCPDSLIFGDNYGQSDLTGYNYVFENLFKECTGLVDASRLSLPATTLTIECYLQMFYGCTGLTTAPVLPATTLAYSCYAVMFRGCTSLTTAPELPATTLPEHCYMNMFHGCTSLTTAPVLPATTLAGSCYNSMFWGCTSLATVPSNMLPATTLASTCYANMFRDCTSLVTAPVLPATTLANVCYLQMFYGCTSLTTAPVLPATTLTDSCYMTMFHGCTSLTTAPVLSATTLKPHCYEDMFYGCSSLSSIKMTATTTSATDCLTQWVENVSPTGTFYKATGKTLPTGKSGIPSGWTVVEV